MKIQFFWLKTFWLRVSQTRRKYYQSLSSALPVKSKKINIFFPFSLNEMKNQRVELHQNSILTMPYDFRDLFFPVFMNTNLRKKIEENARNKSARNFNFRKESKYFQMWCVALFLLFLLNCFVFFFSLVYFVFLVVCF